MSQTDVVDVGQNDKARDHPDNKQKPPPSGIQEYSAQIWFSDQGCQRQPILDSCTW